jgi:hypothetical protein
VINSSKIIAPHAKSNDDDLKPCGNGKDATVGCNPGSFYFEIE